MRSDGKTLNTCLQLSFAWPARQNQFKKARRDRFRRRLAIESLEDRRLLAAGDLDTSFDGDGKLTFSFGSASDSTFANDVKSVDGKIVTAGIVGNAIGVARLNDNGSFDTTFGSGGKALFSPPPTITSFVGNNVYLAAMNVAGSSKIVAAALTYDSVTTRFQIGLIRYNNSGPLDGTLDTSFDGDGFATLNIPANYQPSIRSIAVDSQNRIVVGGWVGDGFASQSFLVARLNPNGSPDTSFSGDGIQFDPLSFNFNFTRDLAFSVTVDNQDRIVAVGYKEQPLNSYQIEITRYNSNGARDTTFDGDGNKLLANDPLLPEGAVSGQAVTVNSAGQIVVASNSFLGFRVSRLLDNGALDTSFGDIDTSSITGGRTGEVRYRRYVSTTLSPGDPFGDKQPATAMQLDAQGRITVAGYVSPTNANNTKFALSRFNENGTLDSTFGGGTLVETDMSSGFDAAYAMAIDANGKIILAGTASRNPSGSNAAIARYDGGTVAAAYDFGDAPLPYPTSGVNAARHVAIGATLGTLRDTEPDGQPTTSANGDDLVGFDEDGVIFSTIVPGLTSTATVAINGIIGNTTTYLSGWIDFNRDGDFEDPNEKIIDGPTVLGINSNGSYPFSFTIPSTVTVGPLISRFRLSTTPNLTPSGPAPDGEVEDYFLYVSPGYDYGDAPQTIGSQPTQYGTDFTRHVATGPRLGATRDVEPAGQPSALANGDDNANLDDEDGVTNKNGSVFNTINLSSGSVSSTVTLTVNVQNIPPDIGGGTATARLSAWIDWDRDGVFNSNDINFNDHRDFVVNGISVTEGLNTIAVPVPASAQPGLTYARFRLSSAPLTQASSEANDGEVEDYAVTIAAAPPTDLRLSIDTIVENSPPNSVVGTLLVQDADLGTPSGDSFTYTIVPGLGDTHNAAFAITGNQLRLIASPDYETQNLYAVRVRVTDSHGLSFEKPLLVYVTVGPKAVSDTISTSEDTNVVVDVLQNDVARPAAFPLLVSFDAVSINGGTITRDENRLRYTPKRDFNGLDIFYYVVNDSAPGAFNSTATVTVNVAAVNDAPIAGTDIAAVLKGIVLQIPVADLLANDTPGPTNESDQTSLFIVAVSNAVNGTVSLSDRGIITFTPAANFFGAASFQYTVQDSGPTGGTNVNVGTGMVNVDVIDRVDVIGPSAILRNPIDNDAIGIDQDRTVSVVQLSSGVYPEFRIQLVDGNEPADPLLGSGVDDTTVTNSIIPGLRLTGASVVMYENGRTLQEGVDYTFAYDSARDEIILSPLTGVWKNDRVYEITVNNKNRFVLTAPAGDQVTDGDGFTITDVNGGVGYFEFDSGYRLQVPQGLTLQIPLAGGDTGGIADGDRFTISSGAHTVTFEFDRNGNFLAGNRPILFTQGASQAEISDAVMTALIGSGLLVTPRLLSAGKVFLGADAGAQLDTIFTAITQPATTLAFKIPALGPRPGGIVEGQTFTISDGRRTVTFEYDIDSVVAEGNTPLDFRGAATVADLTALTQAGLANSDLNIHPQIIGTDFVYLGLGPSGSASVGTSRLALNGLSRTLADGQVFTIEANGLTRTFEFTRDATVTPGNIAFQMSSTETQDEIGARLTNAIADAGLGLTPAHISDGNISIGGQASDVIDVSGSSLSLFGAPGVQSHTRLQVFGSLLLQVPTLGASDIVDNSTFRITNNGRTAVFEFDQNFTSPPFPGNIVIRYNSQDTAADISSAISLAISSSGLGILPTSAGNGILKLGSLQANQVEVLSSRLTTSRGVMSDGETITINNGKKSVTFEFENVTVGNGFTAGNVPIRFNSSSTPDSAVQSMKAVIDGSSLGLTSTALLNGVLELNDTPRYRIDSQGAPTLIKSGVPGGANAVFFNEDANFSAADMMQAIVDAINSSSDTNLKALTRSSNTLFVENAVTIDSGIDNYFLRGVADLAGNLLKQNRSGSETQFTIRMPSLPTPPAIALSNTNDMVAIDIEKGVYTINGVSMPLGNTSEVTIDGGGGNNVLSWTNDSGKTTFESDSVDPSKGTLRTDSGLTIHFVNMTSVDLDSLASLTLKSPGTAGEVITINAGLNSDATQRALKITTGSGNVLNVLRAASLVIDTTDLAGADVIVIGGTGISHGVKNFYVQTGNGAFDASDVVRVTGDSTFTGLVGIDSANIEIAATLTAGEFSPLGKASSIVTIAANAAIVGSGTITSTVKNQGTVVSTASQGYEFQGTVNGTGSYCGYSTSAALAIPITPRAGNTGFASIGTSLIANIGGAGGSGAGGSGAGGGGGFGGAGGGGAVGCSLGLFAVAGIFSLSGTTNFGNSPTQTKFNSDATFDNTNTHIVEIGGPEPGTEFDQVLSSGTLNIGGRLEIKLIDLNNGFTPAIGNSFTVVTAAKITGMFIDVSFPPAPVGSGWRLSYSPTTVVASLVPNLAPSLTLVNSTLTVAENIPITTNRKVADLVVNDDEFGTNTLTLSGPDAASFVIVGTELFLKAGTRLDFETKPTFDISVSVDDITVGSTPDSLVSFVLNLSDAIEPTPTVEIASASQVYNNQIYLPTASIDGYAEPAPPLTFTFYSDADGLNEISAPENVGTYYVRAFSSANERNNAAQSAIASFQITPFALTVSAVGQDKIYDGNTVANVTLSDNRFPGDSLIVTNATAAFNDKNVGVAKPISVNGIHVIGPDAGNYTFNSTAMTTANISAKAITGTVVVDNKVFDGTANATILTRTLAGVVGSDVVTYIGGIATFDNSAIGAAKQVEVTGLGLTGTDALNYSVNSTATTTASILIIKGSVFYNASVFESPANTLEGVAAALDNITGKTLLQSGESAIQTTFANVTNYSRGINGLVFDVGNVVDETLSANDFTFRVPNGLLPTGAANPSSNGVSATGWHNAPAPIVVAVTTTGSQSRIRLEWLDGVIQNTWLQIIVKANTKTGLSTPAVFYIGNAIGEVNGIAPYRITTADLSQINPNVSTKTVLITNPRDIDKNQRITSADTSVAGPLVSNTIVLNNITIPVAGSVNEGSETSFSPPSMASKGVNTSSFSATPPVVSTPALSKLSLSVLQTAIKAQLPQVSFVSKSTTTDTAISRLFAEGLTAVKLSKSSIQSIDDFFTAFRKEKLRASS